MNGLEAAQRKMRDAGIADLAIDVFSDFYGKLAAGETGMIPEADVDPLDGVDRAADLEVSLEDQRAAADVTAVIKLNGGLGTSMGMDRAKSLLDVREGRSFLDLIVAQVRGVREDLGVGLPLVFMNSFRTSDDTRAVLERYPDLAVGDLPLEFLQNREPKLREDDLTPVEWDDESLTWCPPGHGDLYTALATSGVLDTLLEQGFRYATISNSDNLGAAPDPAMMGWFAASGAPYAAEVCLRTPADVKGGHLVVRKSDGRLVLRETAQTPDEDADAAADMQRHRYFHTNNLWFDLHALKARLEERRGVMGLPLIRNVKNVDPRDPSSPKVVQIESAMGAAVEVFDGATAIEVPRSRFLPVKTTNDLALLRSDVYDVADDGHVSAVVDEVPLVRLEKAYYGTIDAFEQRLPQVPSLREARSLTVHGDWTFGSGVRVVGDVELADTGTAERVADGEVLTGD